MAGKNVNLTAEFDAFIDEQVATGRYATASEVVRAALRFYADETRKVDAYIASLRAVAERGREEIAEGRFRLVNGPDAEDALFERLTGRRPPVSAAGGPAPGE